MRKKILENIGKSLDRGPVEFDTRLSDKEGDIMSIANKDVITVPPGISVKEASEIMVKNKVRRLPVVSPKNELLGIITATDIVDFLGGGEKFKIIENKYNDNFLAAVNDSIKDIMTEDAHYITNKDSIKDAVEKMLKHDVGALPVVDNENRVVGIVSERDFVFLMAGLINEEPVADYMTENPITTTPGTPIESVSKIMVRNGVRRVPIVGEKRKTPKPESEKLIGIVTSTDILKFLGNSKAFDSLTSASAFEVLSRPVSEIMQKDVIKVSITDNLGKVYELMDKNNVGGLPVVEDDQLLGIITERDLLRTIIA
ncbi:putative signal transduction protein with CBS domains [Methanothermus fervidus DSM 2088]|uniref:Putative signal transduction protein with CBS domains n=1 Tax=Methanothermus fervidus (strain ATCC 43054 / DSM 2088 / JCM 10308 / V24 S) TaxID=523846 RepID=E3GXK9_METFV|nr:CBS domain-containing protein [Methanothermus fervidus]ADP77041.1 putative signal transduction protein with CBS domains [Methanothermus fervidus DSM 2088]